MNTLLLYHKFPALSSICAKKNPPTGGFGNHLRTAGLNSLSRAVWENIVKSIGQIDVEEGNTLAEQIANNDQRAKLLAQIATLERKMASEKQPRRKREYFEQIKKLKSQI